MFGSALFYPTIDIHNEEWLKNAYLFWDKIYTIVPAGLGPDVYKNNTTSFLNDVGYLQPIRVAPESPVVRGTVQAVKDYAQTEEGINFFNKAYPMESVYVNGDNPYMDARGGLYLHREKLPLVVQEMIADRIDQNGWARVSENFADFYMTVLANRIASQNSLALLTSNPIHEAMSCEVSHRRLSSGVPLAPGEAASIGRCLLTQMMIDGIAINPLTSIEDLDFFKSRYQEELFNFRNGFEEMANMDVPDDITFEGLERKVRDIYNNTFMPAYNDLKNALRGLKIDFIAGGFVSLMSSSFSECFNKLLSQLSENYKIIVGAGAMLSYVGYETIRHKRKLRRERSMSYLLSIERELGR